MNKSKTRTIKVDALARVEGEGSLYVRVKDDVIQDVKFRIFEPPRFFEALLQGRMYSDAPDITARICGICPIAYMMGACHAMEDALGVTVTGPLRNLRRMIYCGEWIESHVLHTYLLHAPDFLGYEDAIRLSRDYPGVVEKALELKKLGNQILEVIGGRAVHPVNLKVGGFYRSPRKKEIRALIEPLKWAIQASRDTVKLFAGFEFPDYEYDYHCVSLKHPDEYAIHEGRIVSNHGLNFEIRDFLDHVDEEHVAHSNALHGRLNGSETYLVGPIARYNNNFEQLSDLSARPPKKPDWAQSATTHFRASWCARWRFFTPARKPCAWLKPTRNRMLPASRSRRELAKVMAVPRLHGVFATIAIGWTPRGASWTPASFRPPRKTKNRSNATYGACSPKTSICQRTS